MPRWKWFLRAGGAVDLTGPAMVYAEQSDAYARGAAPAVRPAWDGPTETLPELRHAPLLPGQAERGAYRWRRR